VPVVLMNLSNAPSNFDAATKAFASTMNVPLYQARSSNQSHYFPAMEQLKNKDGTPVNAEQRPVSFMRLLLIGRSLLRAGSSPSALVLLPRRALPFATTSSSRLSASTRTNRSSTKPRSTLNRSRRRRKRSARRPRTPSSRRPRSPSARRPRRPSSRKPSATRQKWRNIQHDQETISVTSMTELRPGKFRAKIRSINLMSIERSLSR